MNTIKNNFKIYSDIIGKKNLIIIVISLLLLNVFQIPPILEDISLSYNLVLTYANFYYILFLYIVCIFVVIKILNEYNKKYYLCMRYKNIDDYSKKLFKIMLVSLSVVFILNYIFSLIMSFYEFGFIFTDSNYLYYGIKCFFYSLYYYFRLYIIILIFSYMVCKIFSRYREFTYIIIFTFIYIMLMFSLNSFNAINNSNYLFKMFSASYYRLSNYGTLLNETLTFFFYSTIKVGIFNFFINLKLKGNINVLKTNLYYLMNQKRNILFIFIYIIINLLNYLNARDINYLLFSFDEDYMFFISIIMIFCAYFLLISLIYSYIVYDKGYDSYIIKTRINKREYSFYKVLSAIILFIVARIPIYLIARNIFVLYDFLVYIVSIVLIFILSRLKEI